MYYSTMHIQSDTVGQCVRWRLSGCMCSWNMLYNVQTV